ncbi:Luciferin 4-monooxygenase [Operophtera brumata]|uniref:Luciferin 4-monooxygenase n=1 Tax=Operophtera brumata TaxID=104452 RepID=A0A0L7L8G9_OPEBR|nr:Luciferin 4-monooxygenase [Operophtera brumata]
MLKNHNHIHGSINLVVPGHLNFGDYMLEKLWAYKDKPAMQSINFASSLTRMGVRKGDVIGLMSENRMEFCGAVIGVACTGAALATINPAYMKEREEDILLYEELAVDVKDQIKYEDFKSVDVDGQTDTLFIIYSSGTTGLPKGVMLTHLNVITACCL